MRPVDVIIIGGGPAGAACAITCARQGQNTVLLEKGRRGRHKVCGGVMPMICRLILKDDLELKLPDEVMSSPQTLGLFYVPPSGRQFGATMTGYRLLNINRDRFDEWLSQVAEDAGVNVMHPLEPAAGMDIVKIRERYGTRLALVGGLDKHVLRRGEDAIVAELERKIPPMVHTGGCVLGLDHRIPNGTPLEAYRFYVRKAWEIMDREAAKLGSQV